jgi:hypothetical protein
MVIKLSNLFSGHTFIEEEYGQGELTLNFFDNAKPISEELGQTIFESPLDGADALGYAEGVFCVLDGISRNNRLYPEKFWLSIFNREEIIEKIRNREMQGTIGHYDKKVDTEDWAKGLVSHVVTDIKIDLDAKVVYGRLLILDTFAGRNLKALYDAKIPVFVSTRGAGKLKKLPGSNMDIVDENNFYFETVDIVKDPGFKKARTNKIDTYKKEGRINEMLNNNDSKIDEFIEKFGKSLEDNLAKIVDNFTINKNISEEVINEDIQMTKKIEKEESNGQTEKEVSEIKIEANMGIEELIKNMLNPIQESLNNINTKFDSLQEKVNSISEKEEKKEKEEKEIKEEHKEKKEKEEKEIKEECKEKEEHKGKEKKEEKIEESKYANIPTEILENFDSYVHVLKETYEKQVQEYNSFKDIKEESEKIVEIITQKFTELGKITETLVDEKKALSESLNEEKQNHENTKNSLNESVKELNAYKLWEEININIDEAREKLQTKSYEQIKEEVEKDKEKEDKEKKEEELKEKQEKIQESLSKDSKQITLTGYIPKSKFNNTSETTQESISEERSSNVTKGGYIPRSRFSK